jgi:sugar/nucleoside kinase (ribokinase family)
MSLLTGGTVAFDSIQAPLGTADKVVGGAATFISLAASYLTESVNLVSIIGDDFPESTLRDLEKRGVNIDGLQIINGQKSFFWSGKYKNNMNERDTLDTQLNVLANFDPVLPDHYKNAKYIMLGNLQPEVQIRVLDQLESKPDFIALDTMNFWIDSALEPLKNVLKRIDALIINDEEARQLSGEYSLLKAANLLLEMGPKYVIVKKGEHGALLFDKDNIFFAPALPLAEVFDPTGAGDTFAGGLMGYLANTQNIDFENLKRAIIYGSAMASFCVEKFGIERLTELNIQEINERIMRFIALTKFDVNLS